MAITTISGIKVIFSNSGTAVADSYDTTDDYLNFIQFFDVLANDGGGSTTTLWSLGSTEIAADDYTILGGIEFPTKLLVQDTAYNINDGTYRSKLGANIFLTSATGLVGYDMSAMSANTKQQIENLTIGQSLIDSFDYAIRLSTGTLSWTTVTVVIEGTAQPNNAPMILDCPTNIATAALTTAPGQAIVGSYGVNSRHHGFAYDGHTYLTIDVPGAFETEAHGINSEGRIVGGYRIDEQTPWQGFVYADGAFTTLTPPMSVYGGGSAGINDAGQIVGQYTDANGVTHGYLYAKGTYTTLDYIGLGAFSTSPRGINDRGQIVGSVRDGNGEHGFLATPIGCDYNWILFDVPGYEGRTAAEGINNSGEIVGDLGQAGDPGWVYRDGTYTLINPPFNFYSTAAYGIDDEGDIVGQFYPSNGAGGYHTYLYDGTIYSTIYHPLATSDTVGYDIEAVGLDAFGTFAFSDPDLSDTHTASADFISVTCNNGEVSDDLVSALELALTPTVRVDSTGTGNGQVDWQFTFPSAFESVLSPGDKYTASYGVVIQDNHGGTTTQDISLSVLGASNWFNIPSL